MQRIPKNYKRVNLLVDDYKNKANSLKLNEQVMRGQYERIQIASLQSIIPTEFRTRILRNNENKARLIELILKYIKEQKDECLNLLKSGTLTISYVFIFILVLILSLFLNITFLATNSIFLKMLKQILQESFFFYFCIIDAG